MYITCEQEARDLLEEMQVENAHSMSADELAPLANFIHSYRYNKQILDNIKKEDEKPMSNILKTATAHWNYVGSVLAAHGITSDSDIYNACKFHYITAFEHGWKHGVEDIKENGYIFSEGKK